MYLSKLEILGFKSFARKTSLKFTSGVTAIVGPNGCGKTNIVDAIRWALGEQRASLLRSDTMSDVIFNGARARKALGMSEVSLTIENTNGILPTEFSEVTITRRVFRSNESEYLLNKTRCRLKDVLDLFMDTGLSTNAYSVIELKMIETILSDRTDERRKLFEEAAGVTKYKARRKEALRKLDDVQQDLTRVNDIVKEVSAKVRSLERQAEKASEYKTLADTLRAKEINLLEREYAALLMRLALMERELALSLQEKDTLDTEILRREESLRGREDELNAIEERLRAAQREATACAEALTRTEQAIAVAEERARASRETIERAQSEITEIVQRKTGLAERSALATTRIEELEEAIREAAETDARAGAERADALAAVSAAREDVRRAQAAVIESINAINARANAIEQANTRSEQLRTQLDKLENNRRALSGELARVGAERSALEEEERKLRDMLAESEQAFKSQQELKERVKNEIDALQNESFEIQSSLGKKLSKIDFLSNLVEHSAGYSEGVQFLLQSNEWAAERRITVADVFTTGSTYRAAIEAALGEAARFIVVPSSSDAANAITALKSHQKGKATFVCLDRIPRRDREAAQLPQHHHVLGWAIDLVQYNPEFQMLAQTFLDGIAVVQSEDIAASLIEGGFAAGCATINGELVTKRGVVRGGSRNQAEGAIIGKREQIAELENEVKDLQTRLEEVLRSIAEKAAVYDGIDIQKQAASMREAQNALSLWERQYAQLEVAQQKTEETLDYSSSEERHVRAEILQLGSILAAEEPKRAEGIALHERTQRDSAERTELLSALEEQLARANAGANEAHILLVQRQSERQNNLNERARIEDAVRTTETTIEKRTIDIARATEEIEQMDRELLERGGALSQQRAERNVCEERARTIATELSERRTETQAIIAAIREQRRTFETSLTAAHEAEVKLSELKMKSENVLQRAKEEFETTLEHKHFDDEIPFPMTDAREEARTMKQRLRSLGAVNLLAYEEWEKEKERLTFLESQRADLVESEKTLTRTIVEINETAQTKFLETFAQIKSNFSDIFRTLFTDGDQADISLSNEVDDPLEAPIIITAKPHGKRPQSIDLLSAGEKTLTAIALLFAIYLVKPSPFCILDEVDAPLDDANIDRFIRLLRRFSNNTQFIVVTHNKRTMESADTMYGVTMEEEGVSKLVSVRFTGGKHSEPVAEPVVEESVEDSTAVETENNN